ncbi:MAG: amino acid permease, partial [Chloroflexi bacterium]|nr:amino acid permease [Chloroflexota bacterium]
AYSDFPRLSYFLARDGFMPRQFTFRGDRLAYSTGIMTLGGCSILVLWLFGGSISALIPLYAFGVFSAFTLSQSGMVVRWWKRREPTWQTSIVFNAVGATATLLVLLVVAATKLLDGAWIAVVVLPLQIAIFTMVSHHYQRTAVELAPETPIDQAQITHHIILPISRLNQITLQTLAYAQSIARDPQDSVVAVHISDDPESGAAVVAEWEAWSPGVPLVQIESPYRSLIGPLLAFVDSERRRNPGATVTVILPEFVPRHWWEHLLHNQTALRVKGALLFRPGVVVTSVPYHMRSARDRVEDELSEQSALDGRSRQGPAAAGIRRRRIVQSGQRRSWEEPR